MNLLNPRATRFEHLDEPSRQIMLKTIAFFENKGKSRIKHDDHERVWYADFLEFLKENNIFFNLLPPRPTVTAHAGGTPAAIATSMKFWGFMACHTGTPGR